MNGTTRFLATVSEEQKGQTRNVCNRFGYESVALVPIRSGDHIIGLIHVADPREDAIPRDLVKIMEWAAMELGTAIRRVQAQEALQRAYDELEDRVEERTAEIVRASEKLRRSEEELRLLSSQLLTAEENERGRIARELHDGLGQSLSAIKFKLEEVFSAVGKGIGEADVESLGATISLVQNSVEEVRRITMDLRPSTLDDLGILATITWFSREFQKIYSAIKVEKEINVDENDVPESLKIIIFRVLQEALNNAAKHSEADLVHLRLGKTDGCLELAVEDNGKGFEVEEALAVPSSERGFGLGSMKERTELSGGTFVIDSIKGKGTTVRASWPYKGHQR